MFFLVIKSYVQKPSLWAYKGLLITGFFGGGVFFPPLENNPILQNLSV